ncbi:MAG: glycosyltransferase [Phycisphaeraceae bacterium]
MRVLMLGWEFPPFISGGLGTACYGLTKALSRQGVSVLFVLPKTVAEEYSGHVKLLSPGSRRAATGGPQAEHAENELEEGLTYQLTEFDHVIFRTMPASLPSPYPGSEIDTRTEQLIRRHRRLLGRQSEAGPMPPAYPASFLESEYPEPSDLLDQDDYAGDLMQVVNRYAETCLKLTADESFDVIHAHDWMTYPAAMELAKRTGKPLVVHVHSTEFDRAGTNIDSRIYEIERRGMHAADAVICVSYLTGNICMHRYDLPAEKLEVVYNGIESDTAVEPTARIQAGDKIVLFLGRITFQKGPEYFLAAARKVLEKYDNVKFVMAGSGDMIRKVTQLAQRMGISHKVLFTGFLRGKDVERVFQLADVYVMPSVSEPFGIAPLEAIRHDVPVIISRSSGVAEVLTHALKVDFWDVDDIANKIIAVLRHPVLSQTLREEAELEVRSLSWDGAATRCRKIYQQLTPR